MSKFAKFRYYCETEQQSITESILRDEDSPPTVCINNDAHVIRDVTVVELFEPMIAVDAEGRVLQSKHFEKDDMSDRWFPYKFESDEVLDILVPSVESYCYLLEGRYQIDPEQTGIQFGIDQVQMSVVDVDGLYAPAGTILAVKAGEYVAKTSQWVFFDAKGERAFVPPGTYMRFEILNVIVAYTCLVTICMSQKEL